MAYVDGKIDSQHILFQMYHNSTHQDSKDMNRELRKAIYKKQMLRSKFEKYKTNKTGEAYRKQRNLVTKLKRKSINTYFQERCTGGQKSKHFYTTVKPLLSKKSTGSQQKIVLVENDKIVNNTKDICDTFNTFFCKCCK
jgi:hypothetical protein